MEYETIKCPSCGANVHFKPGKSKAICEYCGSTVVSEDYNSRGSAIELADDINNLISALEDRDECKSRLMGAKMRYNDTVRQYKAQQSNKILEVYALAFISACMAFLFLIGIISEGNWGYIVPMFLFGALTYPAYQLGLRRYADTLRQTRATLREYKNNIADYQDELNEIEQNTDFSIVPERYLNVEALQFIANVLSSGEAYDLHQAMAQYNSKCKRREEHEFLHSQLEAQKRLLDEIQASQKTGKRSSDDNGDAQDMEDTIKTVAATGAALYAGYKILREITKP